ncbi:hypothetical protein Hanom_Chr05g00426321 [Helianthus anomalus]
MLVKPMDEINFSKMRHHWKITIKFFGHRYTVSNEHGHLFHYVVPSAAQEEEREEEMVYEENKDEPQGPRGPRQRYVRLHQEVSEDVAHFVTNRRKPIYSTYNRGQ